jgi:hypothetical protein
VATRSPLSGHLRCPLTRNRFSICTTRTMLYSLNWGAAGAQGPGGSITPLRAPSIAARRALTRGVGESLLLKGGGHGSSGCAHRPRTGDGLGRAGPPVGADTVLDKAAVLLASPPCDALAPALFPVANWRDGMYVCPYAMGAGPPRKNCGKRKRS